ARGLPRHRRHQVRVAHRRDVLVRADRVIDRTMRNMSLVQTAKETLDAIERGGYTSPSGRPVALRAAVDAAVRGSIVYRPAELDAVVAALQPSAPVALRIEV